MNRFVTLLAAALMFCAAAFPQAAPKKADTKAPPAAAKTAPAPAADAPTDKQIADAKAKGLVWMNTDSKVYHKDGQFYGKTKEGKFMTEADAQKQGGRAAKASPIGKKKS